MHLTGLLMSLPAFALAVVTVSSNNGALAAPTSAGTLDRRLVGTLSCKTVKTGRLVMVNTKTGLHIPASLANNYRLNDELHGQPTPEGLQGIGNPRILSSYKGLAAEGNVFEFKACTESMRPGFEDYPSETKKDVYYGHLSPKDSPKHCLTKRILTGDDQFVTSEPCNFSDDSGSPMSYFSYSPKKNNAVHFPEYTGAKGGEPTPAEGAGTVTFTPGSGESSPAVYVHDGSADFSDWELRLA